MKEFAEYGIGKEVSVSHSHVKTNGVPGPANVSINCHGNGSIFWIDISADTAEQIAEQLRECAQKVREHNAQCMGLSK